MPDFTPHHESRTSGLLALALVTFLLTLLSWALTTWPLPKHVHEAIPASSLNPYQQPARYMIPGDHLQLLYRFELLSDAIKGQSPWGFNLYEFNRNNDEDRQLPGAYYLPFSFVYFLSAELFGPAWGWNLTGFISLWLSYLFTVLIARRYTSDLLSALIFSLIAVLFPYRYYTLLGGSPTGFAMLWPPVVIYGLELAIRDRRWTGGLIAGLGLYANIISDAQLFLFTFLLAISWGGICLLLTWQRERLRPTELAKQLTMTLWPVAIALIASYLYSLNLTGYLADSKHMAGGRSMQEVAIYSPSLKKLFSLNITQNDHGVYAGYAWLLMTTIATLHAFFRVLSGKSWHPLAKTILWTMIMATLYALAMGARGPLGGAAYVLAREVIPPLQMIRQPSRFLTLAPTLIAVMLCVITLPFFQQLPKLTHRLVLGIFLAFTALEYSRHTQVELCLLDKNQGAYAAIARDHAARANSPVRAMAIPIWPGDSHWSSLYQYYALQNQVRMLNGYSPIVEQTYYAEVFERFRGINAGAIEDDQLDTLLDWGIHYILLHEDAFPEVVSPFPVAHTLNQFFLHPRMQFLERDQRVWAFRILDNPNQLAVDNHLECQILFPSRRYNPERHPRNAAARVRDEGGIDYGFTKLSQDHPSIYVARTSIVGSDELFWLMRAKGYGAFKITARSDELDWQSAKHGIDTDEWTWIAVPTDTLPPYSVGHVRVEWIRGEVMLDYICLTNLQEPLNAMAMAPACFYRSGALDISSGAVTFLPKRDLMGRVFYGPRLPFEPGKYRATLMYASDAPAGSALGTFAIEKPEHYTEYEMLVKGGQSSASITFDLQSNRPLVYSFHFAAQHPITITGLYIDRLQ